MKNIIYRLNKNSLEKYRACLNYKEGMRYEKKWIELTKLGYIDDRIKRDDKHYTLDVYTASLDSSLYGNRAIIEINIPFNSVSEYYFYIDYLYYRNYMNSLNFIILVNRKYLIYTVVIGQLNRLLDINLYNENENTYKSIMFEYKIEYEK